MRKFFGRKAPPGSLSPTLPEVGLSGATFTAASVLAIALLVSVLGSFVTYAHARAAYARQMTLAQGEQQVEGLLRSQLDQETGLRGYLASGQRLFLQPYYTSGPQFDQQLNTLQRSMQDAGMTETLPIIFDVRRNHDIWQRDVGQPLITRPTAPDALDRLHKGKSLVDQMRLDLAQLTAVLNTESQQAADAVRKLLLRSATLTAALMLLFGTSAIVADVIRTRTQVALERERIVGDTLQRAFLSGWDVLPHLRVGTAYVSAARHAAVGGDLFDVHRIDQQRCLLVVADVSGKGLEAAVETAFVKYSLRALAQDHADPAVILKKFNSAFLRSTKDDGSFISLFAAVLDKSDNTILYSSAGHAPAYLRRGSEVLQIPVTGPVIGLRDEDSFPSAREQLFPDDTLVLATDGLTEARDTAGIMLDDEGAMRVVREAPSEPQALADYVVAAVSRLSGGRIADDLALLVIQLTGDPHIQPPPTAQAGVTTVSAA